MAQKLLKAGGKRKSAAKRPAKKTEDGSVVLVGTYREKQLDWIKKSGVYNYPLTVPSSTVPSPSSATGAGQQQDYSRIKELWLYAGAKAKRHCFAAEFVGIQSKAEFLAANPTYAKKVGKPSHAQYAVFKTKPFDYGPKLEGKTVVARAIDFAKGRGQTKKIAAAIKQFHADGEFAPLADYLPTELAKVPRPQLRVYEAAVQLDFFKQLGVRENRLDLVVRNPAEGVKYSMIDLFAGAGGLSEGLEEAGFHGVFASEIVAQYADTYRRNHPGTTVMTQDIRKLDAEDVRKQLGMRKGQLSLIAGGPPCQGFSINAPIRSTLDQRNHLFKEYLRFVDAFQPRAVLIENVPGLVSFENGDTLHAILNALGELGYGADVRILGAAYYGVPQMRWRTMILGLRGKELPRNAFPEPVCHAPIRPNFTATFDGRSLLKVPAADISGNFVSVKEAIGDLPSVKAGERGEKCMEYPCAPQSDFQRAVRRGSTGIYNHEAPHLSPINLQRLKYIKPGGNWTDIPHELLPKGMKLARKSDHTKRYGRLSPDGLASTILTKCDPHWGAYFHYGQDRSLTVREAARCQSFPDHYIFYGSQQEQFAQVGNAVPPMLAKAVGVALKAVLDEEEK